MDAFVLVSSGDPKIREIQMALNRDYHKWIGLKPTDGRYGRDTNKALIYALQVEGGIALNLMAFWDLQLRLAYLY